MDWTKDQDEFLVNNYRTMSYTKMGECLGISSRYRNRIARRCAELGIHRASGKEFNEKYFDNINSESAYVLGYVLGDGSVRLDKTHHDFVIRVAEKDLQVLEQIAISMEVKKDLRYVKSTNSYVLGLSSTYLCKALISLGVIQCKSNTKCSPFMPLEFIYEFILGLIDADGSICLDTRHKGYLNVTICQNVINSEFMLKIKDILNSLGIKTTHNVYKNIINICVSGHNAVKLLDECYNKSKLRNIRKYKKYLEYHYFRGIKL